eukprot:6173581-Pleurochrysis_carterae.AAC.1
MDALKDRFTPEHRAQWSSFFDTYPSKVEDVPPERMHPFTSTSIPTCSLQVPNDQGLNDHQALYAESIRYINPISGTHATSTSLNRARAEEQDAPILLKGNVICILPPADVLEGAADGVGPGEHIPFWLACVEEDEDAPIGTPTPPPSSFGLLCHTNSFGARIYPAAAEDEFNVSWLSVFNPQGRVVDSVVGSWVPRCKHPDHRGRVH